MIFLPKILYLMWNAPLYIPLKFIKTLESMLNSFVWGHSRHKLAWSVLKNPTSLGGAALFDFHDYYLASQLSHFYYFDKTDLQCYKSLVGHNSDHPAYTALQTILRGK